MCSLPFIQAWFIQTEPSRAAYLISLLSILKCQRTKCRAGKEWFQTIYPEFSSLEMPFRGFIVHFMKGRHRSLASGSVLDWEAAHVVFSPYSLHRKIFLTPWQSFTHTHNCSHSRHIHINICSLWRVTAQRNVWFLSGGVLDVYATVIPSGIDQIMGHVVSLGHDAGQQGTWTLYEEAQHNP